MSSSIFPLLSRPRGISANLSKTLICSGHQHIGGFMGDAVEWHQTQGNN